jgi:Phage tail tube protein
MPAIPTVGGVAYFWTGGRQLRVRGDFKVQPNNFQWEGVAGQDGVHGRKRVSVIPTLEAHVFDDCTLLLQDLVAMVDETVTVELDNGKTDNDQHAWYSGLAQFETGEGQIGVEFEALTAHEELAA